MANLDRKDVISYHINNCNRLKKSLGNDCIFSNVYRTDYLGSLMLYNRLPQCIISYSDVRDASGEFNLSEFILRKYIKNLINYGLLIRLQKGYFLNWEPIKERFGNIPEGSDPVRILNLKTSKK